MKEKKYYHLRAAFPHGQPKGGAPNPRERVCLWGRYLRQRGKSSQALEKYGVL